MTEERARPERKISTLTGSERAGSARTGSERAGSGHRGSCQSGSDPKVLTPPLVFHEPAGGISAERFILYIILGGVALFALEQLFEIGAGDTLDQDSLARWLDENRSWAWLAILGLWLVQAVIAPLPAPLLIMVTSVLYAGTPSGVLFAMVLTWVGAMGGAIICFGLSRHFGRDWVVRRGYLDRMRDFDGYLGDRGAVVIFLTRLIPILSFDIVSYAAGLTRVRWKDFVLATGVGMLPTNIIFILFAAEALSRDMNGLITISMIGIIMLAIASYLLVWLMNDYERWKREHRSAP